MTMTEQITEIEDRFFEGLAAVHEQLIEANAQAASRIQDISEGAAKPVADFQPVEAIARYYEFTAKVLDANRQLTEQVIAAWYPAPSGKSSTAQTSKK